MIPSVRLDRNSSSIELRASSLCAELVSTGSDGIRDSPVSKAVTSRPLSSSMVEDDAVQVEASSGQPAAFGTVTSSSIASSAMQRSARSSMAVVILKSS